MRIITGILKGRRLNPTENLPVRPTTDMAREGLFNILNNILDYEELSVLDLFSGTGAVSFEFTPRIAARQAYLSIPNSRSSPRLTSIESVMPSSHLILCRPLFLPPKPPSIRVFSNESTLHMRWPKYWSFSFSISPSKEHPGLIPP